MPPRWGCIDSILLTWLLAIGYSLLKHSNVIILIDFMLYDHAETGPPNVVHLSILFLSCKCATLPHA